MGSLYHITDKNQGSGIKSQEHGEIVLRDYDFFRELNAHHFNVNQIHPGIVLISKDTFWTVASTYPKMIRERVECYDSTCIKELEYSIGPNYSLKISYDYGEEIDADIASDFEEIFLNNKPDDLVIFKDYRKFLKIQLALKNKDLI